jgi:hypothetical protein
MDDLFVLPKPSLEYTKLQEKIDEELKNGAFYSAPTGGNYRQSLQLRDIDGDGVNEALAFFSVTGEHPLRIAIYRAESNGDYKTALTIDGDGTSIELIDYLDLDSDGHTELLIGWRQSADVKMMALYSIRDYVAVRMMATDYSAYSVADFDKNGKGELAVIRHDRAAFKGNVECYSIDLDGEVVSSVAPLSSGTEDIVKINAGTLNDGSNALFVDAGFNGGLITDVFILSDGTWKNITINQSYGYSVFTARSSLINYRDVDGDGIIEIPLPRELPGLGETHYKVLDWYSLDGVGSDQFILTTYHNTYDGWYLIIPASWRGKITVRREDKIGERTIIFSLWDSATYTATDFMAIYMLTGENRTDRASKEGRFLLRTESDALYAAEFFAGNSKLDLHVDNQYLYDNFKLIYSDWNMGV